MFSLARSLEDIWLPLVWGTLEALDSRSEVFEHHHVALECSFHVGEVVTIG